MIPDFTAGTHVGEVTVGEIGALKKKIVFVVDVLNTTTRIQGICNQHKTDLIISDDLRSGLDELDIDAHSLGEIKLKGKTGRITLFSANLN